MTGLNGHTVVLESISECIKTMSCPGDCDGQCDGDVNDECIRNVHCAGNCKGDCLLEVGTKLPDVRSGSSLQINLGNTQDDFFMNTHCPGGSSLHASLASTQENVQHSSERVSNIDWEVVGGAIHEVWGSSTNDVNRDIISKSAHLQQYVT